MGFFYVRTIIRNFGGEGYVLKKMVLVLFEKINECLFIY